MDIDIPAGALVVGVDGSTHSARALTWACEQAHLENRPLALLHAVDIETRTWAKGDGVHRGSVAPALRSSRDALLEQSLREVRALVPGIEVHAVHRTSDPREALLEASLTASMLVLGSRGSGPVKNLLLGSVSMAVSQHACCPVVVHPPHPPSPDAHGIAVGVGGQGVNLGAVEFAYRLASFRSLALTVVHGFWNIFGPMGPSLVGSDEPNWEAEKLLVAETIAGMSDKYPDVHVDLQFRRGLAEDALVRAAKDVEMIVVGGHLASHGSSRLLTDPTRSLLEYAACPVAVVPATR